MPATAAGWTDASWSGELSAESLELPEHESAPSAMKNASPAYSKRRPVAGIAKQRPCVCRCTSAGRASAQQGDVVPVHVPPLVALCGTRAGCPADMQRTSRPSTRPVMNPSARTGTGPRPGRPAPRCRPAGTAAGASPPVGRQDGRAPPAPAASRRRGQTPSDPGRRASPASRSVSTARSRSACDRVCRPTSASTPQPPPTQAGPTAASCSSSSTTCAPRTRRA